MLKDYVEPFAVSSHGGLNHVFFPTRQLRFTLCQVFIKLSTGITTMKWPPQSLYLILIENVWGLYKQMRRKRCKYPSNSDALSEL